MSEPREHRIRVRRTARYFTIGQPGPHVRQVWLVCHGYGQLAARFVRRFRVLDDGSRYIVAPEALNRFYLDGGTGPHGLESRIGATWMTREDRLNEIEDYVHYLDALYEHIFTTVERKHSELIALGFSQGVATVSRWANRHPLRIDHLVLWAGTLPPELEDRPDALSGTRLSIVLGDRDAFATPATLEAIHRKLDAAEVRFDFFRFDGGHELDDAMLLRIAQSSRPRPAA
jgi:predicted esterase